LQFEEYIQVIQNLLSEFSLDLFSSIFSFGEFCEGAIGQVLFLHMLLLSLLCWDTLDILLLIPVTSGHKLNNPWKLADEMKMQLIIILFSTASEMHFR
jgi:hypothetical protein